VERAVPEDAHRLRVTGAQAARALLRPTEARPRRVARVARAEPGAPGNRVVRGAAVRAG